MQKLVDCLDSIKFVNSSSNAKVLIFSPTLGGFKLEYSKSTIDNEYDYILTIPFEDKETKLILNENLLTRLAVCLGIGNKYFNLILNKDNGQQEAVKIVFEMLKEFEDDLYFLTDGVLVNNVVVDLAVNASPVSAEEILNIIRDWYKQGSNESEEQTKEWTDEDLNKELLVYYYSYLNGVYSIGFGLKYKSYGGWLKFNRLGSIKTAIYPCYFKDSGTRHIPIIFDIKGITECKPVFSKNVDLKTNVSTILGESEDFLYDIKDKLTFSSQKPIDSEQYLKHLSIETKIPKKYIKKGIINGFTIRDIVNSICNECLNILTETSECLDIEETIKKLTLFEKLCKSAGYATFYQNRFCNCCFKTATIAEDEV